MPLVFADAEKARDNILASQKKEIAKLYEDWADEIGERAKYYKHKTTMSSSVSEQQMKELQKQLRATSQQVSNEVYNKVKNNMYTVADAVVQNNTKWLAGLGFDGKDLAVAFSSVPDSTVRNIITGQIYDSGWSLSQRIWSDNEQTLKDVYGVVAKGLAENRPIYDIAKNLEAYVRPGAKLPWNLTANDGVKIFKKQVDYNAQRLARTLVQHGYQQSFIATTKDNPFITDYIWISNGSRVCPLCIERNGKHFKKGDLPMDHPNGMCTMEPNVVDDLTDQLADWFNSPDGTYPEIDKFSTHFGYKPTIKAGDKSDYAKMAWYKAKNDFKGSWYNAQKHMDDMASKNGYDSASTYWKAYTQGTVSDSKLDDLLFGTGKKINTTKATKAVAKSKITMPKSSATFSRDEWLSMVKKNTESQMLKWEDEAMKLIGQDGIDGIRIYSGSSYTPINNYLRALARGASEIEAKDISGISASQLKALRNAENGLAKVKTKEELYLRRGTDMGDIAGAFMSGDFRTNESKLASMTVDEINDMFSGSAGILHSFTSTSSLYNRGFSGDVEIIFHAPKGTSASSIMNISKYGTAEGETLLNTGTRVKFVKAEKSNGHKGSSVRIFLDIIGRA